MHSNAGLLFLGLFSVALMILSAIMAAIDRAKYVHNDRAAVAARRAWLERENDEGNAQ